MSDLSLTSVLVTLSAVFSLITVYCGGLALYARKHTWGGYDGVQLILVSGILM